MYIYIFRHVHIVFVFVQEKNQKVNRRFWRHYTANMRVPIYIYRETGGSGVHPFIRIESFGLFLIEFFGISIKFY